MAALTQTQSGRNFRRIIRSSSFLLMTDFETYFRTINDTDLNADNGQSVFPSTLHSHEGGFSSMQDQHLLQSQSPNITFSSPLSPAVQNGFSSIGFSPQQPLPMNNGIGNYSDFITNSNETKSVNQPRRSSPVFPKNVPPDFQPQLRNIQQPLQPNNESVIYPSFATNPSEAHSVRQREDSIYSNNSYSTVFSNSQPNFQPAYSSPHSVASPQPNLLSYSPSVNSRTVPSDLQSQFQYVHQASQLNNGIGNYSDFITNSNETKSVNQPRRSSPVFPKNVPPDFQPQLRNIQQPLQPNNESVIYPSFATNPSEAHSVRQREDSIYSNNSYSTVFSNSQPNFQPYSPSVNSRIVSTDFQSQSQSYSNRMARHSSMTVNNHQLYKSPNVVMSQSRVVIESRTQKYISWKDSLKRFMPASQTPENKGNPSPYINIPNRNSRPSAEILARTSKTRPSQQFVTIEEDMKESVDQSQLNSSNSTIQTNLV